MAMRKPAPETAHSDAVTLYDAMVKRGVTDTELAARMGDISRQRISKLRVQRFPITPELKKRLAKGLGSTAGRIWK